ncbi:MAG: class I SAM-dependent methyltransferase [Geminicoccales bacterium]
MAVDTIEPWRLVPAAAAHDTETPDVATASDDYARRFAGPIGAYFLEVQRALVMRLLAAGPGDRLSILEVGGGHGQLTSALLDAGHEVVVHGSASPCAARLRPLMEENQGRLRFVVSSLWSLPFEDGAFDATIGVRLLAHVERFEALLAEMARVSRKCVIVDFAPQISSNLLEPLLFRLKRRVEGDTRPFFCYRTRQLLSPLTAAGFGSFRIEKQFFLPMVVHRTMAARKLSESLERAASAVGLTAFLGAPAVVAAERRQSDG